MWFVAVAVFLLLWQIKKLDPYLMGLGAIVILGMLLTKYPTIRAQFSNLGK